MVNLHVGVGYVMLKVPINKTNTMGKLAKFIRGFRFSLLIKRPIYGFIALAMVFSVAVPIVRAESIQQQINDLSNKNSQTQSQISSLQLQAQSYQGALAQLQTQISAIQGAIQASENEQISVQQQIQASKTKVIQEKQVLATDISTMYIDGQLSVVEELATSKNLSTFVDQQTYQNAIQNSIQTTLKQISQLQSELTTQSQQLSQLLTTQNTQQGQLVNSENQQANLLSYNQTQQTQYNQQIQTNKSQISALEAEQAAINERNSSAIQAPSGGTGGICATPNYSIGGTYYYTGPEADAPNGSYPTLWCNDTQDSDSTAGGFPNRECTSFAYWYFTTQESGHSGFYVTGNADEWAYTANRPVDQTPTDGSIAVDTSGPYGHVMIVVAAPGEVYDGNTVPANKIDTISMNDDYNGHFFAMQRSFAGFYFIH